ncbi:hypothetical protein HDU96_006389 [Phlyctochytrium bullatum]|nr:hypothetical protein HDU96_006389 [Phlyctochytrium bullatum]
MTNPQLNAFLCDCCERYREIVLLYERGASGGPQAPNFCPILGTMASLTIAKLCAGLWKHRFGGMMTGGAGVPFWGVDPKGNALDYNTRSGQPPGSSSVQSINLGPSEKVVINGGAGVSRLDVASWLARARAFSYFEYLTMSDQVWMTTTMASIFSSIGYKRKHAFYLRQTALHVLSTLRGSRESLSRGPSRLRIKSMDADLDSMHLVSEQDSVTGKVDGSSRVRTNGALECMKKVCEVLGIALKTPKPAANENNSFFAPLSDDEEDWLDDFDNNDDLNTESSELATTTSPNSIISPSASVASLFKNRVRVPRLRHMGREEQLEVSDILQTVVLRTKAATAEVQQPPLPQLPIDDAVTDKPSRVEVIPMPVMARGVMGGVAGVPVVRKLVVLRQPARKAPYSKSLSELKGSEKQAQRDLFIYNPYAQSGAGKKKAKEEKPVQKALDDPKRRTKTGLRRRQEERERFGKKSATLLFEKPSKGAKGVEQTAPWSIPIEVIPDQPLLQLIKPDRISLDALMVFEGERTQFTIELENVSTVPVHFLRLSFLETYSSDAQPSSTEGIEEPEQIFERDVYYQSLRPFWIEHDELEKNPIARTGSIMRLGPAAPELLKVNLLPGDKTVIRVGVFGKRWWYVKLSTASNPRLTLNRYSTGCVFKIEYSSFDALQSDPENEPSHIFTREIDFPVVLTVQPALEATNIDVIIVGLRAGKNAAMSSTDVSLSASRDEGAAAIEAATNALQPTMKSLSLQDMTVSPGFSLGEEEMNMAAAASAVVSREFFLLTFDLKNTWKHSFEAVFETYENDEAQTPTMVSKFLISPNMTKRVMLPLRRVDIPDAVLTRPIPTPQWKQFVVGRTMRLSTAEELARRVAFWLKEELLGGLDVGFAIEDPRLPSANAPTDAKDRPPLRWRRGRVLARWMFGRGRWGMLDALRELRLEPSMVEVALVEKIKFKIDVRPDLAPDAEDEAGICSRVEGTRYRVKPRHFVHLTWTLTSPIDPDEADAALILRIQPVQELGSGQLQLVDPIPLKRLIYVGSLQVPLKRPSAAPAAEPTTQPAESTDTTSDDAPPPPQSVVALPGPDTTPYPQHTVPVMFLAKGVYRFLYHTERVPFPDESGEDQKPAALRVQGEIVWGMEEVIIEVE